MRELARRRFPARNLQGGFIHESKMLWCYRNVVIGVTDHMHQGVRTAIVFNPTDQASELLAIDVVEQVPREDGIKLRILFCNSGSKSCANANNACSTLEPS